MDEGIVPGGGATYIHLAEEIPSIISSWEDTDEQIGAEILRKVDDIDMLSSDHSPSLLSLKLIEKGDFLKAWGGISSLQYVLSATWTSDHEYGVTFEQIASWWSERPAKLDGLHLKRILN